MRSNFPSVVRSAIVLLLASTARCVYSGGYVPANTPAAAAISAYATSWVVSAQPRFPLSLRMAEAGERGAAHDHPHERADYEIHGEGDQRSRLEDAARVL